MKSISDHALIRWLERRHGMSMEAYRAELRAEVASELAVGATSWVKDGLEYVAANGILITVKPACGRPQPKRSPRQFREAAE